MSRMLGRDLFIANPCSDTGFVRVVQVVPSGLVIIRVPVPEDATAQNNISSGDQQTEFQLLSAELVLVVHVVPLGDVITRSPVPVFDTAQNKLSSGLQQTDCHAFVDAAVLLVHVVPLGDVMTI